MKHLADENIEQLVISSILSYNECFEEIMKLNDNDFIKPEHRRILATAQEMYENGESTDIGLIANKSKVDIVYISDLLNVAGTKVNYHRYVDELKQKTAMRGLQQVYTQIKEEVNKDEIDSREALSRLENDIFKIREGLATDAENADMQQELLASIDRLSHRSKGKKGGIPTHFKWIDVMLGGGFDKGSLTFLAARPSMGKTSLFINMIEKMTMNNTKSAIFSYEMTKEGLTDKLLLGASMVSARKVDNVKGEKLTDQDWTKINNASQFLLDKVKNIYMYDSVDITLPDIESICRQKKRQEGLDIVFIDYLQLIPSGQSFKDRRLEIEYLSINLKRIARRLQIPIVVISSLSRATEQRQDKRPMLSDMRESGQIEFDADVVMFIHRESYYDETANDKEAEVIIAKNREGMTGKTPLLWYSEFTKFIDME